MRDRLAQAPLQCFSDWATAVQRGSMVGVCWECVVAANLPQPHPEQAAWFAAGAGGGDVGGSIDADASCATSWCSTLQWLLLGVPHVAIGLLQRQCQRLWRRIPWAAAASLAPSFASCQTAATAALRRTRSDGTAQGRPIDSATTSGSTPQWRWSIAVYGCVSSTHHCT